MSLWRKEETKVVVQSSAVTCTTSPTREATAAAAAAEQHESSETTSTVAIAELESTVTSTTPQSWKEALYRACLAQQCLTRTPHQVLQEQTRVLLPSLDSVIVYHNDPMATAKRIVQQQMHNRNTTTTQTTTSWSRQMVSGLSWTVSKIYERVLGDADDCYYDDEKVTWNEPDDCFQEEEAAVKWVAWEESIVCVELVQQCVEDLVSRADPLLALQCCGTITPTTSKSGDEFHFGSWTGYPYDSHDLTLLAHVLVQAGHAVFAQDYIVFGENMPQRDVDVAVALVQLRQALAHAQRQLLEWTERADECTRRATQYKKQPPAKGSAATATAAALHELQKRKLLQLQIDRARAMLLNLQRAHDALETAHLQRSQVLVPLQATARALRALRQDHSVEEVEDLYDDLREEYDHWNDLWKENDLVNSDEHDDDELMQELERLTLVSDDDEVDQNDQAVKIQTANDEAVKEGPIMHDTGTLEPENQIEPLATGEDRTKTSDMPLLVL